MAASVVLPKASDAREAYEQGQNIQTTEDWNNAAKQILADQTNNKTSSHLPWAVSLETRKELERWAIQWYMAVSTTRLTLISHGNPNHPRIHSHAPAGGLND